MVSQCLCRLKLSASNATTMEEACRMKKAEEHSAAADTNVTKNIFDIFTTANCCGALQARIAAQEETAGLRS